MFLYCDIKISVIEKFYLLGKPDAPTSYIIDQTGSWTADLPLAKRVALSLSYLTRLGYRYFPWSIRNVWLPAENSGSSHLAIPGSPRKIDTYSYLYRAKKKAETEISTLIHKFMSTCIARFIKYFLRQEYRVSTHILFFIHW